MMRYLPKLFLLAMLGLAMVMLWPRSDAPEEPRQPFELYDPLSIEPEVKTGPQAGQETPLAPGQLGGGFEFQPSEQIGADRAVDFPADI